VSDFATRTDLNCEFDCKRRDGPLSPLEILKTAHARIPHGTLGTTTAILGTLRGDDTFRAAWIGDSGMLVIRTTAGDPQVIYRSAEQQVRAVPCRHHI
jgi:hypothetical protein